MASCLRPALMACALLLAAPAFAGASETERRVLAEINDLRAANGVEAVRRSRSLARSAGRYATHILRVDRAHHHSQVWASSRFRLTGENIAWESGSRRDAERVVTLWAESASHRKVLLDPRFTWGGVGREYGRLGSRRATVWVVHLGRR
ncbi:MAG: CAP domain-containing protein [Thermoleophilaceae bacterium]